MRRFLWLALWLALPACRTVAPESAPAELPEEPAVLLPDAPRPDLLVVVLDTTSIEALSVMPEALRFLAEGRSYPGAVAPSNTTVDSVASIFANTWMAKPAIVGSRSQGLQTLAGRLKAAGYTTVLASANGALDHPFFGRGFARRWVASEQVDLPEFPDRDALAEFHRLWDDAPSPRFGWLQLMACHDYRGADFSYEDVPPPATPEALEQAWGYYAADCASTDALLPEVFGSNGGGVTVLLADHGELFGDRSPFLFPGQPMHGHGRSNAPAELRVPLGLRGPGVEPGVVEGPVSALELHPTLLRLAGVPSSEGDLVAGAGFRPAASVACPDHKGLGRRVSALHLDGGVQVVHTDGKGLPWLLRWSPKEGATGLSTDWVELAEDAIPAEDRDLLWGAARPACRGELDLCRDFPELERIGYVSCR